ncbi:serine hydrolase [Lactobacillus sp. XV13L]|nr:serine hydrolase [Lactobacillus sp. XV13L]
MKNKVLIGSLVTTLLAFILYSSNLKRVENANLEVISQNQKEVIKTHKGKAVREPRVGRIEYPNQVKIASGSEKKWAKRIVHVMGKEQTYQVAVQDLQADKFARVANTRQSHGVFETSRLFLLAALYYQQQHGKLTEHTVVKVKKADRVKGERMLQPGIGYGVAYLKQALMRGSQTAGNVLLRKVKPAAATRIVRKMGATSTQFNRRFASNPSSRTSARDLAAVMVNLYRSKTLNQQYSNRVLGTLSQAKNRPRVARSARGLVYGIGDDKSSVALIQTHGHTYCVSVWANDDHNFVKLGRAVAALFD